MMMPEPVSSFEQMLTSFVYTPTSTTVVAVADDSAAARSGTTKTKEQQQRQSKSKQESPSPPKRGKTSPAPPHTPPRPLRRRAAARPAGAAAADATVSVESAATTSRETMAADSALASTSATAEGVPLLQLSPAGPATPLVLPPDKGKGKPKRDQIDAAGSRKKRKKRSSGDGESKPKKKVVVISPYFAAASDLPVPEGGRGVGKEVDVVVQRRTKKKRNPEAAESPAKPRTSGGSHPPKVAVDVKKKRKRKHHQSVQLSTAERLADAYKRVPGDNPWTPPFSHHQLLQESHFFDHWRVLVICMLLNRTTGREVQKILPRLFLLCPDAETTTKVSEEEIEETIKHLGLQKKRSRMIKRMSEEYLQPEWTHVTQLHGIGKYAADAYAIFCSGMWKEVKPKDHKLVDYWRFLLDDKDTRGSIMVVLCIDSLEYSQVYVPCDYHGWNLIAQVLTGSLHKLNVVFRWRCVLNYKLKIFAPKSG